MMPLAVRSELYLSLTSARKLANRPLSLAFRTSPFLAFHSCGVQDMPVEMAALLPSTVMRQSMLAVLKDKDTTGRFLLNFGDTIVEWYRTSKARQTFLHKRTWQKNLRDFVHSLDKDDIAFEDIDENFGEEYKLFLKRDQGRIDSYVNHCLLWLNMLMYKAVDRSIIRFNPIAKIGYERKAAPKMTHISKADFIKMLSTPMADERTELADGRFRALVPNYL